MTRKAEKNNTKARTKKQMRMARQITRKNTKPVLSGGFLSKFRRGIRARTQKIMNRNPLGYIAQFKKVFRDGAITGTEYKYLIMGHGDDNLLNLLVKELKTEIPDNKTVNYSLEGNKQVNNTTLHELIPIDEINDMAIGTLIKQNTFLKQLYNKYKLGFISKSDIDITVQQYSPSQSTNQSGNKLSISNYTYSGIRIFIYKPSSQEQQNAGNTIHSSSRRSSSRSSIRRRSVSSHQ